MAACVRWAYTGGTMRRTRARFGRRPFLQGSLGLGGLALLAGCAAPPWAAPKRPPRLGFVSVQSLGVAPEYTAFLDALRGLGYVPGETIQLDTRWGDPKHLGPDLAALAGATDLLVAVRNDIIRAVKQAAGTIPIVMVASADPIRSGLVASLARPGGNITGLTPLVAELNSKRLELLKAAIPGLVRVGLLGNADDVDEPTDDDEIRAAAQQLGLQLASLPLSAGSMIAYEIGEQASAKGIQALMLGFDPTQDQRVGILRMMAERRLPVIYPRRDLAAEGGLMAYGPSYPDLFRRAAAHVDKILKGAKPADLPVEQATRFDMVINLKTARALGLSIPESVLQQATEVIQ